MRRPSPGSSENADLVADDSADQSFLLPRLKDLGLKWGRPRFEIGPKFGDGLRYIGGVQRGQWYQQPHGDETPGKNVSLCKYLSSKWNKFHSTEKTRRGRCKLGERQKYGVMSRKQEH